MFTRTIWYLLELFFPRCTSTHFCFAIIFVSCSAYSKPLCKYIVFSVPKTTSVRKANEYLKFNLQHKSITAPTTTCVYFGILLENWNQREWKQFINYFLYYVPYIILLRLWAVYTRCIVFPAPLWFSFGTLEH